MTCRLKHREKFYNLFVNLDGKYSRPDS
jgi:hypothetical protein